MKIKSVAIPEQTKLFDLADTTVKEKIVVKVRCEWKIRDFPEPEWRKYETPFCGSYTIETVRGHPEINGGCYSPDFDMTEQEIKDTIKNHYDKEYREVEVILIIEHDDRQPKIETLDKTPCLTDQDSL